MKVTKVNCIGCGAGLKTGGDVGVFRCRHCGTEQSFGQPNQLAEHASTRLSDSGANYPDEEQDPNNLDEYSVLNIEYFGALRELKELENTAAPKYLKIGCFLILTPILFIVALINAIVLILRKGSINDLPTSLVALFVSILILGVGVFFFIRGKTVDAQRKALLREETSRLKDRIVQIEDSDKSSSMEHQPASDTGGKTASEPTRLSAFVIPSGSCVIVSWNLQMNATKMEEKCSYIIEKLSPSVLLLQEAHDPALRFSSDLFQGIEDHYVWSQKQGKHLDTGSLILCPYASVSKIDSGILSGWVTLGSIKLNGIGQVGVASVQSPTSTKVLESFGYSTCTDWLRQMGIPKILEKLQGFDNILIGGDFNVSRHLRKKDELFFRWVSESGFTDAHRLFNRNEQRSIKVRGNGKSLQDDHIILLGNFATKLFSCEVLEDERIIASSDHNPIAAVLK